LTIKNSQMETIDNFTRKLKETWTHHIPYIHWHVWLFWLNPKSMQFFPMLNSFGPLPKKLK
jgi:hypothetical protein